MLLNSDRSQNHFVLNKKNSYLSKTMIKLLLKKIFSDQSSFSIIWKKIRKIWFQISTQMLNFTLRERNK